MKTKILLKRSRTYLFSSLYLRRNGNRCLLFVIGCFIMMQAKSQTDKLLVLADQYFTAGDYFTAAGLYDQFLHPVVKQKYVSSFPLNVKRSTQGRTGNYKSKANVLSK